MRCGAHLIVIALAAGIALPIASPVAEEPELHGVPQGGPAVERQAPDGAHESQKPPEPPPITVRILQSDDDAARAQAREAKADEHDAKDLETQIRGVDAAVSQKWAAWTGVGLSLAATVLLFVTLWYTRRALRTAELANALTRAALEADRRPWVELVKADIGGPLSWSINGGRLSLVFLLRNVGPSPAIGAKVSYDVVIDPDDMDLQGRQRAFADAAVSQGQFLGHAIFPGAENVELIASDIPREPFAAAAHLARDDGWVTIYIVGCVTYRSPFSEQMLETGFIYSLKRITDGRPLPTIGPMGRDIPAAELALVEWLPPSRVT